ncbi:MAG: TolC family protein [Methylococcales bacterium]|nr:TolC family protein [Methylococcales bacterium]
MTVCRAVSGNPIFCGIAVSGAVRRFALCLRHASGRVCFIGLWLFCLALVTGCAVDKKNFASPIDLPETFSRPGDATTPDQWWQSLDDPNLERLIALALRRNLDLLATFNRLEQSRAVAVKAGSELVPQVNGVANANGALGDRTAHSLLGDFSTAFTASYELDLWGRIRSGLKAAELDIAAAEMDTYSAAISLTAEIASVWYQWVEQQQLLRLLNAQIETNKQYVALVQQRFRAGIATPADVFQQKQLLEGVFGDRYSIQAQIDVLHNRLAILCGVTPDQLTLDEPEAFPELTELPKTGSVSELIARRPDIRKSYYRLQAADLRIAAAVADRLPKISLSASLDTRSPDLSGLFNNWLGTLAGNILLPLIDGGRRVAEVERNEALTREALNDYGQTILIAINEVENALAREIRQHLRLASLKTQLSYLTDANMNIAQRSAYGAFDFLRILSTLNSLQAMQRSLVRAQRELIAFRIDLYRALAGAWPLPQAQRMGAAAHG